MISSKAVSLKSHNESTFKDEISEYHTVNGDDSGQVHDIHKYMAPDNSKPQGTVMSEVIVPKNDSEFRILELKTQIQSIFDDYNKNMGDFELFKRKFNRTIKEYKRNDSITQSESFIEENIEHSNTESDCEIGDEFSTGFIEESNGIKNIETTFYTFHNNFGNFTSDEASFDSKNNSEKTFVLNLSGGDSQCIERELNRRGAMSDNKMCKKLVEKTSNQNITTSEKTTEPQVSELEDSDEEKYIPIKNSYAKEDLKNKREDNDYYKDQDTLFIFKICSYICKKIRRNPIA